MNSENLDNKSNLTNEISLKELLLTIGNWYRYLLSKWIVILIFGLIGGVLGFTYSYFKKITYTAITSFVLEDGDGGGASLGQYAGLASMVGVDLGGGGGIFQGDNILELYKSRTMIEKTLLTEVEYDGKKQLLVDKYIDFNKLTEKWLAEPHMKGLKFKRANAFKLDRSLLNSTRLQDSVLGVIVDDINKNYLSVGKPDKKMSLIKVEVRAKDEFFAKSFNDWMVKNVNDFYIQAKTKKSLENVRILQQKVDSVRAVMNGAIYSAAIVSDATPNLNPTRQVQRTAPMQRSQFTAETNKAILSELVKNLEMSKMSLLKEAPLIQEVDYPVYPLEKEKLGKAKAIGFGGLMAGFITIIYLLLSRIIKEVMK